MAAVRRPIVVLLALLVLCAGLDASGALWRANAVVTEWRAGLAPRPASGRIAFLAIDRRSLDAVGVWPWPREVHARAIDALVEAGAADIFLDIDFSTPSDPGNDARLAKALEDAGGAVLLPTFAQADAVGGPSVVVNRPIPTFAERSWPVSVNVSTDRDGIARRVPVAAELDGEIVPSAPAVLAGLYPQEVATIAVDFSIDPGTIPTYSLADLLAGQIDDGALRDRTVVVGAHALELRDTFAVPVHQHMAGPVLQILGAESILQGRSLATVGALGLAMGGAAGCVLMFLALGRLRLSRRLGALAAAAALVEAAALVLQIRYAVVLPSVLLQTFLAVAAIVSVGSEMDLRTLLLRLARREANNSRHLFERVFADTADAMVILDRDGATLEHNARAGELFGRSAAAGTAETVAVPRDLRLLAVEAIARLVVDGAAETRSGDLDIGPDLTVRYAVTASRLEGARTDDALLFAAITATDVTALRRGQRRLEYLSRHDSLTGALKRDELARRLDALGGRADAASHCVMALNIRRFRMTNTWLGREAGDRLLALLVERLDALPAASTPSARLDGDTFALCLGPVEAFGSSAAMLEAVRVALAEPFPLGSGRVPVAFRMGVAHVEAGPAGEGLTGDALIARAEIALDEAREHERTEPVFYRKDEEQRRARTTRLEGDLRRALEEDQFWVAYQPIVEAANGVPSGTEALIRWSHPELGFVSPGEFIEIAEASGFIDQLGRFTLMRACRDALDWPDHLTVSVNVAAGQFARGTILEHVREALRVSGLPARRLWLELTESSFLEASDAMVATLDELAAMGVSLALDDFGTGYSSLRYLSRFPLNKIKVDQMFVRDIAENRHSQAIVRSTRVLASGLDLEMVCEGVETEREWKVVRELGCELIQGYLFAKPMPASEARAFLWQASAPEGTPPGKTPDLRAA